VQNLCSAVSDLFTQPGFTGGELRSPSPSNHETSFGISLRFPQIGTLPLFSGHGTMWWGDGWPPVKRHPRYTVLQSAPRELHCRP
jgi:hypothetical protein